MTTNRIDLSTPNLNLTFQAQHTQLRLESFSAGKVNWLHSEEPSGLFGVMIDGQRYSALNMDFTGWREAPASPDVRHVIFSFQARRVQVDFHLNLYPDSALMECWLVVFNHDPAAIAIQQLSSYSLNLPSMSASLLAFTGDWGSEFSPQPTPMKDQIVRESRSGRSS